MIKNIIKWTAIVLWLPTLIIIASILYNHLNSDIGYQPSQPVRFSHKVHSKNYGIKCLFCHHTAELSSFSAIPSTESCMICHVALKAESELIKPVIASYDNRVGIPWIRINRLPEYTHFNHSSHVQASIDCSSCHGKVEEMDSTFKTQDFTMKWCLDCHRNPEQNVTLTRNITGAFGFGFTTKKLTKEIIEANTKTYSNPSGGEYFTGYLQNIFGIKSRKAPGRGPETCSSCHY